MLPNIISRRSGLFSTIAVGVSVFLMAVTNSYGQAPELVLQSGTKGVAILLMANKPALHTYSIKRTEKGNTLSLPDWTTPADADALMKKVEKVNPYMISAAQLHEGLPWYTKFFRKFNSNNDTVQHLAYSSPALMMGLGIAGFDERAEKGKTYTYEVFDQKQQKVASATITYNPDLAEFPAFRYVGAKIYGKGAKIEWRSKYDYSLGTVEVFRSRNNSDKLLPVNLPVSSTPRKDSVYWVISDTTLRTRSFYRYALVPVNMFGVHGKPTRPENVRNFTTQAIPQPIRMQAYAHPQRKALVLKWLVPTSPQVKAVEIYKSRTSGRGFYRLAVVPASDTMYIDPVAMAGEAYHYYLRVLDAAGQSVKSVPFFGVYNGSIKPNAPTGLTAKATANGIVLHWDRPMSGITSFAIYRASGRKSKPEYVATTGITDSLGYYLDKDPLLTATNEYSYAIKAINDTHTESDLSDFATARPVNTVITVPNAPTVLFRGDRIRIHWENLNDREAFLQGYLLYRKSPQDNDWVLITAKALPAGQNAYTDSLLNASGEYAYALKAINNSGVESAMSAPGYLQVNVTEAIHPERIKGEMVSATQVRLSWAKPASARVKGVQLYRITGATGEPQLLSTLSPTQNQYDDNKLSADTSYRYFIQYDLGAGVVSAPCTPISIRTEE